MKNFVSRYMCTINEHPKARRVLLYRRSTRPLARAACFDLLLKGLAIIIVCSVGLITRISVARAS